ncbi:hypothetical protein LINPERPRIM_LOCUS8055 [Linum perenne]
MVTLALQLPSVGVVSFWLGYIGRWGGQRSMAVCDPYDMLRRCIMAPPRQLPSTVPHRAAHSTACRAGGDVEVLLATDFRTDALSGMSSSDRLWQMTSSSPSESVVSR